MKFLLIAILGISLVVMNAFVWASSAEAVVFGDHPEQIACSSDDDCLVVMSLCGEWRPVNRTYQEALTDAISYLAVAAVCNETKAPTKQPGVGCTPEKKCEIGF